MRGKFVELADMVNFNDTGGGADDRGLYSVVVAAATVPTGRGPGRNLPSCVSSVAQ